MDTNLAPDLTIRRLDVSDLGILMDFRNFIFEGLSNPDWVLPEENERRWAIERLAYPHHSLGVFDRKSNLIAYANIFFPKNQLPPDFKKLINLPEEDIGNLAVIDSCMVHPDYRNRSLQKYLIDRRLELARDIGKSQGIALTSLKNHASRHNLLSRGFHIVAIGQTEPKRYRQVLMRYLSKPIQIEDGSERIALSVDINAQELLLVQGYLGISDLCDDQDSIIYAQPKITAALPKLLC